MAQTLELAIEGMTCDHCVRSVTSAIAELPGVAAVNVSLEAKSAVVEGDALDRDAIIKAVEEEGYEARVK